MAVKDTLKFYCCTLQGLLRLKLIIGLVLGLLIMLAAILTLTACYIHALTIKHAVTPKFWHGFHPKQTMQHHFREALGPQHEGIWLLDEDISLARTNLTSWLSLWRCAFPGGHPLVTAAPIKQSTQAFWPHNWLTWTPGVDHGWLGGALGLYGASTLGLPARRKRPPEKDKDKDGDNGEDASATAGTPSPRGT